MTTYLIFNCMAKKLEFPEQYLHVLGTIPDRDVAKLIGCSTAYVAKQRKLRSLDAPGTRKRHEWTAEEDALLGTDTDAKIAARLNVSTTTVSLRRRIKQIDAFAKKAPTCDAA